MFHVLAILISIFIVLVVMALLLSYEMDTNDKTLILNRGIFFQSLSAAIALFAIGYALFQEEIKRKWNKTDIDIEDNAIFDNNSDWYVDDDIVNYYFHLKIINLNSNTTIKNCRILIHPGKISKYILDIPRQFKYAGENVYKKNIIDEEYVDIFTIEMGFNKDNKKAILKLSIEHFKDIIIDLLEISNIEFYISANSSTINQKVKYKIAINADTESINNFINKSFEIYDGYKKTRNLNNKSIDEIKNEIQFDKLYEFVNIDIKRV